MKNWMNAPVREESETFDWLNAPVKDATDEEETGFAVTDWANAPVRSDRDPQPRQSRGFGSPYTHPEDRPGLLTELGYGLKMGVTGVRQGYHGTRALLGSEGTQDQHLRRYRELGENMAETPLSVPEFTGIRNPADFARWAVGQSGALAPIVGSIMAGGAVGGKAGAAVGATAGTLKLPVVGTVGGAAVGGIAGSAVGSFTVGYKLYAGGLYGDLREMGADHDASRSAALTYGAPAAGVSIIVPMAATASVMGYLGKDFLKQRARNIALGAGLGATTEGLAEGIAESFVIAGEESVLGRTMSDEERRNRVLNAAAAGTLMGIGTGALGGGQPQASMDSILDNFVNMLESEADRVDHATARQYIVEQLEAVQNRTPEQDALLQYAKTNTGDSNRLLNQANAQVQQIAFGIAQRSGEQNVARLQQLLGEKEQGTLTGEGAIELTALLSNSPAARQKFGEGLINGEFDIDIEGLDQQGVGAGLPGMTFEGRTSDYGIDLSTPETRQAFEIGGLDLTQTGTAMLPSLAQGLGGASQAEAAPPVAPPAAPPLAPEAQPGLQLTPDPAPETQAPPADQATLSSPSRPGVAIPRAMVMASELQTDAVAYQYKADADAEGVTERLQGVKRWDDIKAGRVVVHERLDGTRFVADGHQRLALARRLEADGHPPIQMDAIILREADGFTVEDAREMAATKNIAEGTGTAWDAARVFQAAGERSSELSLDLPPNSAIVRDGRRLANLSPEATQAAIEADINPAYAGIAAQRFSDPMEQMAAIQAIQRTNPATQGEAHALMEHLATVGARTDQSDMFGGLDDSVMRERMKIIDKVRSRILKNKAILGNLLTNQSTIESAAQNIVDQEGSEQAKQDADAIARLMQHISTNPELNQYVSEKARQVADGEIKRGEAIRQVLDRARTSLSSATTSTDGRGSGEVSQGDGQDLAGTTPPSGQQAQFEADQAAADRADQSPDMLQGDGDLFAGPRPEQGGMFDSPAPAQTETASTTETAATTETAPEAEDSFSAEQSRKGKKVLDRLVARLQDTILETVDEFTIQNSKSSLPLSRAERSWLRAHLEDTGASVDRGNRATGYSWESDDLTTFYTVEIPSRTGAPVRLFASKAVEPAAEAQAEAETQPEAQAETTQAQPEAAPADQQAEAQPDQAQTQTTPQTPIEDFGERIFGARKDFAESLEAAAEKDVASVPLSQSWPQPNYQKLIDDGADPKVVALVRAMRDEVPAKPRRSYHLRSWAEQVETLRDFSIRLLREPELAQKVEGRLPNLRNSDQMTGRAELYERFGHEKSLKGIWFTKQFYTLYKGEENVTKWVVEKKAAATAFSNFPRQLAVGDTREEALAKFGEIYGTLGSRQRGPIKFSIYSVRSTGDFFIGRQIGKNIIRVQTGFESADAAREYLNNNQAELEAKLERMRDIPDHRNKTNAPRVGVDHLGGREAAPELWQETFGFRGVQFGNWVEQSRRQDDLNDAYDALMDLAGIIDVPAKALSLNGELGLAFGARGRGGRRAAMAHYESDNVVINLTKRQGAGSLAHEWWHALDNYFGRRQGAPGDYMTGSGPLSGPVRPEVVEAFRQISRTLRSIGMFERAKTLDGLRSKDYWSTSIELSARAFESYVIAKLADQNASNDYLANIVSEQAWAATEGDTTRYPYPTRDEMDDVRAAFDNFFQTIEAVESEAGFEIREQSQPYSVFEKDSGRVPARKRRSRFGQLRETTDAGDTPTQGSLFLAPSVPAEQRQNVARRVGAEKVGSFRSGIDVIQSAEDVAHIVAPLGKKAAENYGYLVADAEGRPLAFKRDGVGRVNAAQVNMQVIGGLYAIPGAAQVWSVHNHPSGASAQSPADMKLAAYIYEVMDNTGLQFMGSVVVAPEGEFSHYAAVKSQFSEIVRPIPRAEGAKAEVPIEERTIRSIKLLDKERIQSPQMGLRIANKVAGEKLGVLLLDNKHKTIDFLPMSSAEGNRLRTGDRQTGFGRLAAAIESTNTAAAIVYDGRQNPNEDYGQRVELVKNISNGISATDVRVLDAMIRHDGSLESLAIKGEEFGSSPTAFYSVNDSASSADPFYSAVARAVEGIQQNKAQPKQWLAMIQKQPGVKKEELDWIGLPQWLDTQSGAVTKEDVAQFVAENRVQIKEVTLAGEGIQEDVEVTVIDESVSDESGVLIQTYDVEVQDGRLFRIIVDEDAGNVDVETSDGDFIEVSAPLNNQTYEDGVSAIRAYVESLPVEEGADGPTQFEDQQMPGGENYKELLLTLAPNPLSEADRALITRPTSELSGSDLLRLRDAVNRAAPTPFYNSHFDQPNTLAHVRFNERTNAQGQRVLFIEEVQSDWHQAGRKQGYLLPEAEQDRLQAERIAIKRELRDALQAERPESEIAEIEQRLEAAREAEAGAMSGVPDAPFKQSWPMLVMKRMIRYAAENGFDQIAWTPGQVQADRYNLRKSVESISWDTLLGDRGGKLVTIMPAAGQGMIEFSVNSEGIVETIMDGSSRAGLQFEGKRIDQIVGKGISDQIMAEESGELSGQGLEVGGEGMRAFYDRILKNEVNKYVKRFGAQVGIRAVPVGRETNRREGDSLTTGQLREMGIPEDQWGEYLRGQKALPDRDIYQGVWSIDVTPQMRETAMSGQPMFATGDQAGTATQETFRQTLGRRTFNALQSRMEFLDGLESLPGNHPENAAAVFLNGKMYVNTRTVAAGAEAGLVLHEIGVHEGMREFLGQETYDRLSGQLQRQIDRGQRADAPKAAKQAWEAHRRALVSARASADYYRAQTGRDMPQAQFDSVLMEETWAYMAQEGADSSLWQRFVSAIKAALARMGLSPSFINGLNNSDIATLARGSVARIVDQVEAGQPSYAPAMYQSAYHGTPHLFDRFSLSKVGTGEGAQAYGWGLYFAGKRSVAEYYRDALSVQQNLSVPQARSITSNISAEEQKAVQKATKKYKKSLEIYEAPNPNLFFRDYISFYNHRNELSRLDAEHYRKNKDSIEQRISEWGDSVRRKNPNWSNDQVNQALQWMGADGLRQPHANAYQEAIDVISEDAGGNLFQANIPEDSQLLDYDKPLNEQPESVREGIARLIEGLPENVLPQGENNQIQQALDGDINPRRLRGVYQGQPITGARLYTMLHNAANRQGAIGEHLSEASPPMLRGDQKASRWLNDAGIPGLRYLDATSRGQDEGSRNYVIWDENAITIEAINDQVLQAETLRYAEDFAARDAEYRQAVESGDMETAQRLVDEAARAAGYAESGYHGTSEQFTRFDPDRGGRLTGAESAELGLFFADQVVASSYAGWSQTATADFAKVQSAVEALSDDAVDRIYEGTWMADRDPMFDRESKVSQILDDVFNEIGAHPDDQTGILSRIEAEAPEALNPRTVIKAHLSMENPLTVDYGDPFSDARVTEIVIEARGKGHDGVILKDIDGTDFKVVFRPEQVKSAEPATYDDAGNLIPLSERFNRASDDIRYSSDGTIDVDGQQRPRMNSAGRPIHPTEDGIRNFWRWFGDSQAVDSEGRPLVVYHGTGVEFSQFSVPAFFSEDLEVSRWYSEQRESPVTVEAYLAIASPLDLRSYEGAKELINIAIDAGVNVETTINENPSGWTFFSPDIAKHSPYDGLLESDLVYIPAVRDALVKNGYDGIRLDDLLERDEIPAWIAIHENQIKSATDNTGLFDPSADIRYSVSPSGITGISLSDSAEETGGAAATFDPSTGDAVITTEAFDANGSALASTILGYRADMEQTLGRVLMRRLEREAGKDGSIGGLFIDSTYRHNQNVQKALAIAKEALKAEGIEATDDNASAFMRALVQTPSETVTIPSGLYQDPIQAALATPEQVDQALPRTRPSDLSAAALSPLKIGSRAKVRKLAQQFDGGSTPPAPPAPPAPPSDSAPGASPRIRSNQHILETAWTRLFESAADNFEKTPGLEFVGTKIRDFFDGELRYKAMAMNEMRAAVKAWTKLPGALRAATGLHLKGTPTREQVEKEFGDYFRATTYGGNRQAIYDAATQQAKDLIDGWNRAAELTGRMNQELGVQVLEGNTWRPIGKVEGYFPRVQTPKTSATLNNPSRHPEHWGKLVDALMAEGYIESRDKAQSYIRAQQIPDSTTNDFFSAMEKARTQALPDIFYDWSLATPLSYIESWATRYSQIEQFGQQTDTRLGAEGKDLFGALLDHGGILDQGTRKYIKAAGDRIYNYAARTALQQAMATLNMVATGAHLGNPGTATLNLIGGSTLNWLTYGEIASLKAYAELVSSPVRTFRQMRDIGVLREDVLKLAQDYGSIDGALRIPLSDYYVRPKQMLSRSVNWLMKWGGYLPTEHVIRMHGALAGKHYLLAARRAYAKNPKSATTKRFQAFIERSGFDMKRLMAADQAYLEKWLRFTSNLTQGTYRIDQSPIFTDVPEGRFLLKYQKFGTQVNRLVFRNHIRPFVKSVTSGGETLSTGERARTFMPMLRFFYATALGGAAIGLTRQALFDAQRQGPQEDEVLEALKDDDRARALAILFSYAGHQIAQAGGFGFIGNYGMMLRDFTEQTRVKDPLNPPGLAALHIATQLAVTANGQGRLTADDMDRAIEQFFSFYRNNKRVMFNTLGAADIETFEGAVQSAIDDRRYIAGLARRFANDTGLDGGTTGMRGGAFVPNENTPTNRAVVKAIRAGRPERAQAILDMALDNIDDPREQDRLIRSVRASVRNGQPLRLHGRVMSAEQRDDFLEWIETNVGERNRERILRADENYRAAAADAGLRID